MNWKKWDEHTWINMNLIESLQIQEQEKLSLFSVTALYPDSSQLNRKFKTHAEAEAFVEELIKPKCDCDSCLTLDELMK